MNKTEKQIIQSCYIYSSSNASSSVQEVFFRKTAVFEDPPHLPTSIISPTYERVNVLIHLFSKHK